MTRRAACPRPNQAAVLEPELAPELLVELKPESDLAAVDGAAAVSVDFDPESPPPSDLAEPDPDESLLVTGLPFAVLSDFSAGLEPLFLKSVAYQPEPFNWNPAAVNIF